MRATLKMFVAVLVLAACGGPSDGAATTAGGSIAPNTSVTEATTSELVPVEEAQQAREDARAVYGTIGGDAVDLDQLRVAVNSVDEQPSKSELGTPVLGFDVRVENPSNSDAQAPDINLICGDDVYGYVVGSTYPPDDRTMPPGTYAEGKILLEYPGLCDGGYLEFQPLLSNDRTPVVRFALDDRSVPAAPTTTVAEVSGSITTPAEAAAALVEAGVVCDRYLDSDPSDMQFGPPSKDGSCDTGGFVLRISVFENSADGVIEAVLPAFRDLYKGMGVTELSWVTNDNVVYNLETSDGSVSPSPTEAERQLLEQIADATGGDIRTFEV